MVAWRVQESCQGNNGPQWFRRIWRFEIDRSKMVFLNISIFFYLTDTCRWIVSSRIAIHHKWMSRQQRVAAVGAHWVTVDKDWCFSCAQIFHNQYMYNKWVRKGRMTGILVRISRHFGLQTTIHKINEFMLLTLLVLLLTSTLQTSRRRRCWTDIEYTSSTLPIFPWR